MARVVATPPDLRAGELLDRYELICPVAEGGMGTVWLARLGGKHGFEKLVAVKTILPSYAWDPRFQSMFLDEARTAAGVVHPNVAQILDLGEYRGVLYFAMKWVDGDPFRALLKAAEAKQIPFPTELALRVVADVCAGLHAAHEAKSAEGVALGIVHRDVSPQNVLVTSAGAVKLIDFGIAKSRGRAASETATGEVKGKARYMAPEQALGCKVDRRADVWAVGAILYETLAGRPLSKAKTPFDAVKEMLDGYPRDPLPPHVPPAVQKVVDKALAADLEERYTTAEALQRAIEAAASATGLTATSADLAAFAREHMPNLAAQRRAFLDEALASLAKRRLDSVGTQRAAAGSPSSQPWALSVDARGARRARPAPPPVPTRPPKAPPSGPSVAAAPAAYPSAFQSSGPFRAVMPTTSEPTLVRTPSNVVTPMALTSPPLASTIAPGRPDSASPFLSSKTRKWRVAGALAGMFAAGVVAIAAVTSRESADVKGAAKGAATQPIAAPVYVAPSPPPTEVIELPDVPPTAPAGASAAPSLSASAPRAPGAAPRPVPSGRAPSTWRPVPGR